jgi:hypothetical protein
MNEKYLKDLYGWIVQNDSTYGTDVPYATFIQKMQDPSYAKEMHGWVGSIDPSFTKDIPIDSFLNKIKATEPSVEKKNSVVSGSSSADASSGSSSQETEDDGILSKIGNAALKAQAYTMLGTKKVADAVSGIASNIWSEGFLKPVDDVLNAFKNQLNESNFFGGDIPDTDKPASDAVKNQLEQLSKKKGGDMSPIDPRAILQGIGNVSSLIINSVLPQEQKTKSITALANASSNIKDQLKDIEEYQQKVAPEGVMKIPYEITKNIAGMAPDLVLAAAMDNPAYAESAAAKWAETTTKKAVPVIEKYSPQAAKVVEKYLPKTTKLVKESVTSPFTKIMATKGAIKGMAETKEGEDPYVNSLYGALEGAAEGAYMHVLGVTAGEVSPAIAKLISKTGLNSAIATAISNPLANAGVFTSAKALRVAATERRALTPEEMIMEAGTGVGFSLLHAGSIYKNQNEANHYYESVLSDNPINSLGRVINETKANLDISYDPNLTQDDIQAMMTARDAIKKAILREPDMQKKKTLGDEAVKLQNKIDAHNTINDIVEHRDALINLMNNNKSFGANEKKMIIDKISAIADAYDNSTFGTRKRELNTEIMNLDAELSDLSDKFTNSKLPSERASIKAFIDAKRAKLAELNNELTELVTNKQKEDAVQKQTTNESVLLGQQPELGLQEVGEGNAKLEITPEQSQAIADEKDAFQEILDNPDNHDETDVQEAKDYFADPIKYYEEKIKFYEEEANPTEDDVASLDYFKKMLEAHKAAESRPEGTTIQAGSSATVSESTPEVTATPASAKGTTITIGAGGATATTSGGPTEVTTGGEGTETMTSGTDIVKTKKNEDNEHTVTLNGKEIGKMYYDPSQKTWQNANFSRAGVKPYSVEWIYGDVLGESKQEAIDELVKRSKNPDKNIENNFFKIPEPNKNEKQEPQKEEPQKVQFVKDNILNRFLNKLNSLNPLQKNPIDNKSFVYGNKASLEFNRFDKRDRNEISIESILSLDKGKGTGKAVMKDITDAADALGVKLTLDAKPFGRDGLSKKQLIDFYKKNGFKVDFEDAFGGAFKTEQELIDYALENESEAVPMSREPKTRADVTSAEGTETKTGSWRYEFENTKIEDDGRGNLTVTLDGKPIGRMVIDKEFGNFVNADFNKAEAKPYTAKSFYGDVLGRTQEQAVNELLKRNSEAKRGDVTMAEGTETKTGGVDVEKELNNIAEKNPKLIANAASKVFEDAGYHVGNLQDKSDYATESYNGDMPFTGYYFVSDPNKVVGKESRKSTEKGFKIVDFSKYNLLKLTTPQYWVVKNALKRLATDLVKNKLTVEESIENNSRGYGYSQMLEYWMPEFLNKIKNTDFSSELKEYSKETSKDDYKTDRLETRILKKMGYEGVDVRDAKETADEASPDSFTEGSAIFDLKEGTVSTPAEAYNEALKVPEQERTEQQKQLVSSVNEALGTTIKTGSATVSEGKPTNVTMAEGNETKTSIMDDIELLIPKYKEYVDRDLNKAKDKLKVAKKNGNATKIEEAKKTLDKAKAAAEEYKAEVEAKKKEALKILTESNEYKTASQVQQDAMVKEVVRKFGERVKKAPSAETILGIEPPKVVTMTEKAALKEQIKAFGRGVKEGLKTAKDLMERRKVFAAAIKQIEKSGAISTKKVDALLNKISKVNLEDDAAVEKVIEYAEKLFEDAEYDNKLNDANGVRAAIKALASNKKKNAELSVFAKQFLKIRPSDVENIDEYNEMAKKLRESLEGSKITKDKNNPIKIADMIDIAKMGEYVDKMLEAQYKIDKDKLIKSARGIMGDDATFLSDDEVLELIKTGQVEGNTKVDDSLLKKITERVNKIFDSSAAMVDEMLRTGKDPLTGEDIDLSENRKKIAERFMSMDMRDLSDKEKLGVIDALNNFIRNGSVANMETVYADYKAKDSLAKAIENNVVAKKLKLFFSKKTGRAFGQQISTLPNLTEQMFRGVAASEEFKRLSGITELVNKKASVQRTMNVLTDSFIKQFYNQKANGKAFDTADNVAERGIIAAMKRDIPGTPEQQKAEFKRKKELVEKSIELLRDGTEQERKMADVYQKSYDKVLKDSNTVDEVLKKSDDKNIEAVDWWIDKWSDIYDQLADVSESIYNKKLDRDLNYTNFKFSLLSGGEKAPELSSRESVFLNSNNDIFGKGVYKKKTGVLEKSTRPEADGMEDRYFDLSFDRNMINAYQDALMDINTAGTVRQIESFFSSKAIKKIIPNKEDRDLLFRNSGKEGVIPDLIRTTRQRQVVVTDELTSVFRKLSNLGTAGAATALAGVTQPVKQTIPVAINTIINAGKMPDFFYFRNKDKVNFINNSQRGIAIRGGKSRVSVDSINKLAEAAATSKASKVIELLGKANEIALKAFVEKPDVWIAKASWITYYEKGLKKQGIDPSKFDYAKDKINEEAADYAQDMVDRQQNISDADLQGKLMNTKDPIKSVMVKTVMPFASFRMNQTMRMYSDLKSLFSKKGNATKEDRITAFKSLAGYGAEMATFKYTQYLIASYIGGLAVQAMGINETDDDKKKREEMLNKSQTTGTVTDVLSPLPVLDVPVAIGADKALSYFQDLEDIDEEDKFNLMTSFKQNGAKSLGLYGIAVDKANSIIDAFEIATTGKYTDEYGREKYVSRKTADALGDVALMSTGSSLIGFPAEMNAVLRNSLRLAKKNSSTKQGGKEAYTREVESKRADVLKKKEDKMKIEVEALNRMLEEETEPDKRKEIKLKIREAKEAPYKGKDQKEEEKMTRREEKEKLEEMLQGYDSKSDMKRYDPDLYEKTFGEGSDYYEKNNTEKEVKSDLTKEKKIIEDEEYDYSKRKKRKKNRDGTYKKSYYKSYFKRY